MYDLGGWSEPRRVRRDQRIARDHDRMTVEHDATAGRADPISRLRTGPAQVRLDGPRLASCCWNAAPAPGRSGQALSRQPVQQGSWTGRAALGHDRMGWQTSEDRRPPRLPISGSSPGQGSRKTRPTTRCRPGGGIVIARHLRRLRLAALTEDAGTAERF